DRAAGLLVAPEEGGGHDADRNGRGRDHDQHQGDDEDAVAHALPSRRRSAHHRALRRPVASTLITHWSLLVAPRAWGCRGDRGTSGETLEQAFRFPEAGERAGRGRSRPALRGAARARAPGGPPGVTGGHSGPRSAARAVSIAVVR